MITALVVIAVGVALSGAGWWVWKRHRSSLPPTFETRAAPDATPTPAKVPAKPPVAVLTLKAPKPKKKVVARAVVKKRKPGSK